MKRIVTFLCLLIAFLFSSGLIVAQEPSDWSAAHNPNRLQNIPTSLPNPYFTNKSGKGLYRNFVLKDKDNSLKEIKASTTHVKKAAPTSIAELTGSYVMTFRTAITKGSDGGSSVTITQGTSNDSILIDGFWQSGIKISAKVDLTAKTINIPCQKIYIHPTYGDMSVAVMTSAGKPDRTAEITGVINDDGSINITSWWAVFVDSGEYADGVVSANQEALIERSNGTMTQTLLEGEAKPFTFTTISYNVVLTPKGKNMLTVKNFANYGQTVNVLLNYDKTATIENQMVRNDATNGDWYSYAIAYNAETGQLTNYANNITAAAATDNRNITWNNWTLICSSMTTYLGVFTEGKITADFDISYPEFAVTDFEGEGTEASPYLIKTADDLCLLSAKVAEVNEYPYSYNGVGYARIYMNKFFRMENDIDMSEYYHFTPIGNDWKHSFAGTFDGNGHTIMNLDVYEQSGYAGLFGRTDTISVIKNLTMDKPVIRSGNYYAATIAGWSLGTIDNCHVTNADIYNTSRVSGCIAGAAKDIRNSTVTNSTMQGLGGTTGSVAGEVAGLISNCYATGMDITTATQRDAGYPSGGLVGSIYKGKAENCYFSGIVDGSSLYSAGQCIGGIAGACYYGEISRCFSVATVSGYSVTAKVGGVVGYLTGKLTDSYAIGRVDCASSKAVGGIAGYLAAYTDGDGNVVQPTISSCYTATQVTADLYLYNPEQETREVIGNNESGTSPIISNVYFDNQLTNFTSTKYGVNTSVMTSASGLTGFDGSVWTFKEGQYPVLSALADAETSNYGSSTILLESTNSLNKVSANAKLNAAGNTYYKFYKQGELSDEGYYGKLNGSTLEINDNFGTDTLLVCNGRDSYHLLLKIAPLPFEGDGTELNPYLIKTKADVIKLSEVTTDAKQMFEGTYFKMANDIDMELDDGFKGICASSDATLKFSGIFDGDGHSLHRLYISSVDWKVKPEDTTDGMGTPNTSASKMWRGFIGRLGANGVIKNLNMASDCSFSFWSTSAPFVGINLGLVDNCHNYANVIGYSNIMGGIVGKNDKGGSITSCYNAGNIVSGNINVGGIAGINDGTIENCANAGNVEVKSVSTFQKPTSNKLEQAGGIVGSCSSNSVIRNVVNAGCVYAHYSCSGGIVGMLSTSSELSNAINYGMAYTNNPAENGAITGALQKITTSKDNYWDAQIIPLAAAGSTDCDGMNGVETSVLTSGKALENFSTDIWQFNNGQYPVLKQFADEVLLSAASKVIVSIPTGVTVKDLSADATLNTANGETWTLAKSTAFKIEGTTLKTSSAVTEVTVDTLTAKSGDYVKPIVIKRMPPIPVAGSGTEADPYIISNATEWNALSSYMNNTNNNLSDKFVKIAADIDFSDVSLSQFGADGVTSFNATMDGNNKKLSGINLKTTDKYQGVFGVIGGKGSVKNLTLAGTISSAYAYTGGFVGKLYGQLSDCINEIDVTSTKADVAGFAGYAYGDAVFNKCVNKGKVLGSSTDIAGIAASTATGVTFTDCGNEGTIANTSTNSDYTGGIVGTSMPATFSRCYNTGVITILKSTAISNVGGIVGYAKGASGSEPYVFTDCYNTADITAASAIGGIVGSVDKTAGNAVLNMYGCHNEGNITSAATKSVSTASTAGIAAMYSPGSVIDGCWNTGTIKADITNWTAGITATYSVKPTESLPVTVKNCYNTGQIVAAGKQAAGIMACCFDYTTIDSCYNTGTIEGDFGLGGIVDYLNGVNSVIKNCWNSADITSTTCRVGGIVAWGKVQGRIENCFNTGNITTTGTDGGTKMTSADAVGGIVGESGAYIINCYNTGTVTGQSRTGGIVGAAISGKTSLSSCYNIGKIVAPADTCGALIGQQTVNNSTFWNEENTVTDCYYVTDLYDYGTNNAIGTAKTVAELAGMDLGEAWTMADKYSFPTLKSLVNDAAKANAAAVVLADGDKYSKVTKAFFVGVPEGTSWSASDGKMTINGNDADFDFNGYSGETTLTATCGDFSRSWVVTLDGYTSSLSSLNIAGKSIVSTTYYTTDGRLAVKPLVKDGKVYIVSVLYDDGSHTTVKLLNK